MSLLAQLHHTTVRFSSLFAKPLPKTVSDSCRNLASIPTYSLIIMFDIKGQIPGFTLFLLCSFICFFNGRYSRDYALELWNWPVENIPSCMTCKVRTENFLRNNRKLFILGSYSSFFRRKRRLILFMHKIIL